MNKNTFLLLAGLSFFTFACNKDNSGTSNIVIKLTDSPILGLQQVNVDVQQVSVHLVPNSGKADWIDLPTNSGVYDLLKLQNGVDTTIVDYSGISAGKITQMRLLLGTNNTLMIDSTIYMMKVPSGSQSGIKITGDIIFDPNQTVNVLLDFDADKSVVKVSDSLYHLKPVIKTL